MATNDPFNLNSIYKESNTWNEKGLTNKAIFDTKSVKTNHRIKAGEESKIREGVPLTLEIKNTIWTIEWETKLYLNKFTIFIYERIIEREKGY